MKKRGTIKNSILWLVLSILLLSFICFIGIPTKHKKELTGVQVESNTAVKNVQMTIKGFECKRLLMKDILNITIELQGQSIKVNNPILKYDEKIYGVDFQVYDEELNHYVGGMYWFNSLSNVCVLKVGEDIYVADDKENADYIELMVPFQKYF